MTIQKPKTRKPKAFNYNNVMIKIIFYSKKQYGLLVYAQYYIQ